MIDLCGHLANQLVAMLPPDRWQCGHLEWQCGHLDFSFYLFFAVFWCSAVANELAIWPPCWGGNVATSWPDRGLNIFVSRSVHQVVSHPRWRRTGAGSIEPRAPTRARPTRLLHPIDMETGTTTMCPPRGTWWPGLAGVGVSFAFLTSPHSTSALLEISKTTMSKSLRRALLGLGNYWG